MSSQSVRTAFESALSIVFPAAVIVNINNSVVDPPKDSQGKLTPFLGVFYLAMEEARGIGKKWRETGTINVLIYALSGRGDPTAMADALRNAFAGKDLPVAAPGVRLALLDANPLTPYLGGAKVSTGVYDVGLVAISYQFDYNR